MPNETIPTIGRRYYPTLSTVVSIDDLPDILGFIKDGVGSLLDTIHFKDLQSSKSPRGDAAFYSLSIVSPNRIDIEIPGTGIYLVLNPDIAGGDSTISSFPITIEYQWKVLAYLREFSLGNFSFEPQEIFEMALRILNITEEQALAHFINTFVEPADVNTTALEQFVVDINSTFSSYNITAPTNETTISEVVEDIYTKSGDSYSSLIAFATYIPGDSIEETKKNIKTFFNAFIPDDIEEYIKDVLIPKFKATLTLSAGIEMPRKYMTPVYPSGTQIGGKDVSYQEIPEDPNDAYFDKVMFSFGEAVFYADTEEGFGYNMDLALSTVTPVQLGKTGIIVNLQNLKLDLSQKTNIAEADADGRPVEFMGVYVDEAEVFLPKKWFSDPDSGELPPGITVLPVGVSIKGTNLLIGTGGISGTIGIEGNGNLYKKLGNFWIGLDSFSLTFKQNAITESNVTGKLIIPKFKDKTTGGDLVIDVKAHIGQDGEFNLTASNQAGIPVFELENVFSMEVNSLFIGRQSDADGGKAYIGVSGKINFGRDKKDGETDADFDADNFSQFLPKDIDIKKMLIYDDGSYEFEGGGLVLPKTFEFKLGPAKIAVTAIHMGSYEKNGRKYKFFGFDGGVSVNPGGVDARGKGVKLFYTIDDGAFDWFIRLESLKISIVIP